MWKRMRNRGRKVYKRESHHGGRKIIMANPTAADYAKHFKRMARGKIPVSSFYVVKKEKVQTGRGPPSITVVSPVEQEIERVRAQVKSQYGRGTQEELGDMPKNLLNKAKALLKRIDGTLTWNRKGEIVYKGRTVHGSDIGTLIEDAVRPYSNDTPVGKDAFYRALADMDIPNGLIYNKLRLLDMEKRKRQQFGPPGKRAKYA